VKEELLLTVWVGMREMRIRWHCHEFVPAMPRNLRAKSRHFSGTPMRSWHSHDKRFTPWHAIWRASEGRNRDSVYDGLRVDTGSACQAMARISKCSRHGTQQLCLQVCSQFTNCSRKWHDNFVVKTRDILEYLKFSPRHDTHYFT